MQRSAVVVAAVVGLVLLGTSACGGDGGAESEAEWQAAHGRQVEALSASLTAAQSALHNGEPVGIRTSCGTLRDSEQEGRRALPVPDEAANAALRRALDAVSMGTSDCLTAIASADARRLERSIAELREAKALLDDAEQKLDTAGNGR